MGKLRRKAVSDKVRTKKKVGGSKGNPFEVKINRQKHQVIGRKISKHDKGMPGLARSKAIKKRKETLLVEYKQRGKANKFIDRRFGENNPELSVEEKMLERFALERQRNHEKSSVFKLGDEEGDDDELTHYGQSLSEIEKFEDPVSSDTDDDQDLGNIGASIVGEEHFGGGMLSKKTDQTADKPQSWKERMEQIIAKSKKHKYERQSEKERTKELTEKVDLEWKDLRLALATSAKGKKDAPKDKKREKDDFDILVRELHFETKGKATDRLKTEEELAQEEKDRLEKLETDRRQRMAGITEYESQTQSAAHASADSLDDGFILDSDDKDAYQVSYKDGKLIPQEGAAEAEDEENEEDGDEGSEAGEQEDVASGEEDYSGGDSGEDSDAMAHTSDLESSADEDQDDEKTIKDTDTGSGGTVEKQKRVRWKDEAGGTVEDPPVKLGKADLTALLKKKKEMMETARKELPYTFPAPESYGEMLGLFEGHSDTQQLVIIDRIRKCHHSSLAEGNKEKMQTFLGLLVMYMCELAIQDPPAFDLMDKLTRPVYELTQQSPEAAANTMIILLKEKHEEFKAGQDRRRGRCLFPTLDALVFLKLLSVLFPTSDFRHPVITPAFLFMSQLLTQCSVSSMKDVTYGMFVCNLFLEYVSLSKRYVPEVINFLHGILFLASNKDPNHVEPVVAPFKPFGKNSDLLYLQGTHPEKITIRPVSLWKAFSSSEKKYPESDEFRIATLTQCFKMLNKFTQIYDSLPSYIEIFRPIRNLLPRIPMQRYPPGVQELLNQLLVQLEQTSNISKKALVTEAIRPKPLKLYEPKVIEGFDGSKRHAGDRKSSEKKRLVHKYKKEMKGAIREIRKDSNFLAGQKLEETLQRDAERKRKVKEIYNQLANQEGEFKALKRMKDRL